MVLANQTNPNQSPSGATQKSVRKWEVYTSLPHHRMDHPPPFDGWFAPNKQTTHMSLLRSSAAACAFSPIHMSPLRGLRVIVAPPYMHIPIHIGTQILTGTWQIKTPITSNGDDKPALVMEAHGSGMYTCASCLCERIT